MKWRIITLSLDSRGEGQNTCDSLRAREEHPEYTTFATLVDFARVTRAQPLRIVLCVRISPSEDQESDGRKGKREEEAGQNRAQSGI